MADTFMNYLTYKKQGGTLGSLDYATRIAKGATGAQLLSQQTNSLTNPPKSAANVTKGVISGLAPDTSGVQLNKPTVTQSLFGNAAGYENTTYAKSLVGGAENTINGKPIPTSGVNDPSMFAPAQGDGLTAAQRSAKYNVPSQTPTAGTPMAGGGGSSNPISSVQQAYNDALRANSKQALQYQQESVAAAFQANAIQNQLNKNLTDLISSSQQQAAQSQEILTKALSGLQSGSKGAQTGMEAVDVSEQMAKEDAKRRDLRRTSAADTKKAGLLSQKALLSKPTLLGV